MTVTDSPKTGSPEIGSPEIGSPEIGSPEIGSPEIGSPEIGSALAKYASSVDRNKWISIVEERFGIPAQVFDPYFVVRPSTTSVNLVLREHTPPRRPEPQIVGMSFMRTRMRFPKLTTAAAMAFGAHATRNHIALSRDQADRFLSRELIEVSPAQTEVCTGTGYVLVRVEEVILGVGLFRPDDSGGSVKSLLPKAWTLADDESAFEN